MNVPTNITESDTVFRTIATVYPAQDLLDDLVDYLEDTARLEQCLQAALTKPERITAIVGKSQRQWMQETIDSKFTPQWWSVSQFSHLREFYKEELAHRALTIDRQVTGESGHHTYFKWILWQDSVSVFSESMPLSYNDLQP